MSKVAIIALILSVARENGLPPNFVLAVASVENSNFNPSATHLNNNGTTDLGLMMLNNSWYSGDWEDPETNIRAGCLHIKELLDKPGVTTYWDVAVRYNAGCKWYADGEYPPAASIEYANRVYDRWHVLEGPGFWPGSLKRRR